MKALILAAGLGTRLRPHTNRTPKPLFSIDGRPLLDRIVDQLHRAGCLAAVVNTHHLSAQIEKHIASRSYPIPVSHRHEPTILGTGGAIRNLTDFWDNNPFMVINCDIVTDIDLGRVYDFHLSHHSPATLVLTDMPEINTVIIDRSQIITDFVDTHACGSLTNRNRRLTFTGIQVLDPSVLDIIPERPFVHSIDVYRDLIAAGTGPRAFVATNNHWVDMGTPEKYREAAIHETAATAWASAFGKRAITPITRIRIAGDGSDRRWHRLSADGQTLILAEHGIREHAAPTEVDSFISIGIHLHKRDVPVPKIFHADHFAGLVFLEDLGNMNLQRFIKTANRPKTIRDTYERVIDILIHMNTAGKDGFDPAWTYQTARYDTSVIINKECRYFVDAFLKGWLGMDGRFDHLAPAFEHLAQGALSDGFEGFMHRDFQSRNIMVRNGQFYLIDFQGGRIGPIQYDLASLLIDPYVQLPMPVRETLLEYCINRLAAGAPIDAERFRVGYRYCCITRNLQILGAFGFLSRIKKKTFFAHYIPAAFATLKENLEQVDDGDLIQLKHLVQKELPVVPPAR